MSKRISIPHKSKEETLPCYNSSRKHILIPPCPLKSFKVYIYIYILLCEEFGAAGSASWGWEKERERWRERQKEKMGHSGRGGWGTSLWELLQSFCGHSHSGPAFTAHTGDSDISQTFDVSRCGVMVVSHAAPRWHPATCAYLFFLHTFFPGLCVFQRKKAHIILAGKTTRTRYLNNRTGCYQVALPFKDQCRWNRPKLRKLFHNSISLISSRSPLHNTSSFF